MGNIAEHDAALIMLRKHLSDIERYAQKLGLPEAAHLIGCAEWSVADRLSHPATKKIAAKTSRSKIRRDKISGRR